MLKNLAILGIFDSFEDKNSALKNYEKRLHEYQEHEADTLIDIGVIYLEDNQIEEALGYFKEAQEVYEKLQFPEGEAYTQNLIGDTYLTNRNLEKALKHYQKSFKIYSSLKSPLSDDIQEKLDDVLSLQEYKRSMKNNIKTKNPLHDKDKEIEEELAQIPKTEDLKDEESYIIYPSRSTIPRDAIDYEKLGAKLDDVIKILENVHMYETYSQEKDPITYLKDAYVNSELIGDKTGKATIGLLIGDVLLKRGESDKALKTFKDSFNIFHENNDEKGEALSLLLMGSVCYVLNDQETMYKVFKKSVGIFKRLDDQEGESVAINLINTLYSG